MKYILYKAPDGLRAAVFPVPTTHAEEAAAHPTWQPISAGFVEFLSAGNVRCFGRSESLKLAADPSDSSIIEVMMSATLKFCAPQPIST
jgi:hypothetical protein